MNILITGGRGFVGEAVQNQLRKHTVFTFDRHEGGKNHIQGDITSKVDVFNAVEDKDEVIHLIGLSPLKKPKKITYEDVHVHGTKHIVAACKTHKVKRLIHMSALGADPHSPIEYLRTKGIAEQLVKKSKVPHTIFCPSVIFDGENELIQQIRKTAYTLFFPNIPAKLQPLYRGDVAKLFRLAVEGKVKEEKITVGGPQTLSIYDIAKKIHKKKKVPCFPIPLSLLKTGMNVASLFGLFGITKDQVRSLTVDNIVDKNHAKEYISLTSFDAWLKNAKL